MTTSAIKLVHEAIGRATKSSSFVKKGGGWYADRNESILVISPQKSQYGQQYYLNLGVYFKELGSILAPKEQECHLRARLSQIVSDGEEKTVEALLDFEQSVPEREECLANLLRHYALPFLEACSSIDGVRHARNEGRLGALPVMRVLRETL